MVSAVAGFASIDASAKFLSGTMSPMLIVALRYLGATRR
jgi:hypothetical protein